MLALERHDVNFSPNIWTPVLSVSESLGGPNRFLHNGYRVSSPDVKSPGRVGENPPPSRAEVKKSVALYFYCPSVPSWQVRSQI